MPWRNLLAFVDFNEERQMFNEINVVVVWKIRKFGRTLAARRGMGIEDAQNSPLVEQPGFPDAKYRPTLLRGAYAR